MNLATATAVPTLFAASPAMRHVVAQTKQAAASRHDLLIQGEPGTGREMLARTVHAGGSRTCGSFVGLDGASMTAQQCEVELFGRPLRRARGTSGSNGLEELDRRCKISEAQNGTLFIRRLVDIPVAMQERLARVLHDRRVVDAESGSQRAVDVRLVTAVEPSFESARGRGRVEPSLLGRFRLRIDVPPLRNRREDIPALATWFLEQWCVSTSTAAKTLTDSAAGLLAGFPWRGNAWELRNFVEAVAGNVRGREIRAEELLTHIRLDSGALAAYRLPLREARRRFEREYIATVLEQHHGHIHFAARTLGMQRTNLYRKLRQLRIAPTGVQMDTENADRP